jgi:hypothetical protein
MYLIFPVILLIAGFLLLFSEAKIWGTWSSLFCGPFAFRDKK